MRSSAHRLRFLLAGMALAGCTTATPAATTLLSPSGTSPADASLGAPSSGDPARRALLVDTDVAADDLVALAFLVASPHVEIVAITVSGTGEAHCAGGVKVVLRLLDRLDAPDIPVACGRETPLAGAHAFPDGWRAHVDVGSGIELEPTARAPSPATAVELITALAAEHESLIVLTLGPLTNLADALISHAGLAETLGLVFVMGGALHVPGNLVCCGAPEGNSVAEWNVYVDPRAANVVVDSGVTPSFVSLDGTNQVPLTRDFAARVIAPTGSEAVGVVAELLHANPHMTDGSYFLWDPLAAQLAAGYPIGSFSPACIIVEEAEGPESGFTRPTCETPNIRYLTTVDAAAAEGTLLDVLNEG